MSYCNIPIPSNSAVIPVDTRLNNLKVLMLPTVSTNSGRYLLFKDYYGTASNSSFTISTTGTDLIDDYNFKYTFSNAFGGMSFVSDGLRSWRTMTLYDGLYTPSAPSGLLGPANPLIYLTPSLTFPAYTTPSAPTFGATFITFPGATQYLDFGSQTFPMGTSGFSVKVKLEWTAFQNWSRVFDFNSGDNGNLDTFLTFPGSSSNPLRFMYRVGGEQQTNYGSNFALNTIYNISIVYNPTIGSVGAATIWVNGVNVVSNTTMGAKATDRTNTRTFIGRSSYADAYLAARIYFFGIYNRPLTDAEASQIL
jgi:hypothetical protein